MTELEKVIEGIEACNRKSDNGSDCKNCPYYDDEDASELPFGVCNIPDMLADALALLKAQMPRVMTLEEAREAIRDGGEDVIFWEEKTSLKPHKLGIGLRMIDSEEIDFQNNDYVTFDALDDQRVASEYGSLFRLWTSRPSPELMASTPWEGDSDANR